MEYNSPETLRSLQNQMDEERRHQEIIREMRSAKRINAVAVIVSGIVGAIIGAVATLLATQGWPS